MKAGDQVMVREVQKGPLGSSNRVLRFANIVSVNSEKKEADIMFASANPSVSRAGGFAGGLRDVQKTRKVVPLSQLELVSKRFGGRNVVQVDPNRRSIGQLLHR